MMMTLTIVLAEISVVLLAVLIVIGVKTLRQRRRDREAVNTLVISIKTNQPARVEKLAGMLKESSHLSEGDALNKANELIKKQNIFYQHAIDLYYTRNHEVLSKLDSRLEGLLDQYQGLLKLSATDKPGVDAEAMGQLSKNIAALSKELEDLRTENATLSTQLKAAEHELDQLGREYVSAFNKPKVDKPKVENNEASQAAETGQAEAAADKEPIAEQTTAEAEHSAEGMELNAAEAAETMEATVVAPVAEAAPVHEVDEPSSVPAAAESKADARPEPDASSLHESDDQNLFTDLGLHEFIGEHPGQPVGGGKSTGNN